MTPEPQSVLSYLEEVTTGLDPAKAREAFGHALEAARRQLEALATKNYTRIKAPDLARAVAHTAKAFDELYRLASFASGGPDHRVGKAGEIGEMLKYLSEERLKQLEAWIEEGRKGR